MLQPVAGGVWDLWVGRVCGLGNGRPQKQSDSHPQHTRWAGQVLLVVAAEGMVDVLG